MAVVPVLAVTRQGGQSFVFVAQQQDGHFIRRSNAGHAGRYGGQHLLHHFRTECGRQGDRLEHAVPGEWHAGDAAGRLRAPAAGIQPLAEPSGRRLALRAFQNEKERRLHLFVDFFIHRPVFATVCALLIILAGAICIPNLPIAMYPTLAPPLVAVTCNYVGANAETVEKAVTIPLEEAINGVEGMRYISSSSTNSGTSQITITFQTGYNLDIAAVDVQNRVASVQGRLPAAVNCNRHHHHQGQQQLRLWRRILSRSTAATRSEFISNYLDVYVKDALKRVPGVGDVMIFGERKYAMRVWLDPVQAGRAQPDRDRRGERACRSRTSRFPPASSASRLPIRSRLSRFRCAWSAGSPAPRNSTTSSSRTPPTAWCC